MLTLKETFGGAAVDENLNLAKFHEDLQTRRSTDKVDLTLKDALTQAWGDDMTPDMFYRQMGIDLKGMTVDKILNTGEMSRWLFPEIIRDAIRIGLLYTPFYSKLIAGEDSINSTGLTMPYMDYRSIDQNLIRLRDVKEGATITESEVVVWREKQVNITKKARGLLQTYESLAFVPIDLASLYFEELGVRLGADLDASLINVAINGEQADNSESAPVMGATTSGTLTYFDIARVWVRFKRIFRNATVMLMSEADAITVLNMQQFLFIQYPGGVTQSGVTLNVNTPLPTSQDIYVHNSVPSGTIVFVDVSRMAIQITAQPLLTESDKIIRKQMTETFVSIMTGFAILFKDGRIVLNYNTSLGTNPGPTPIS